jgi:hypothetical protein
MPYGNNPKTGRPGPEPQIPRDGDKAQARQSVKREIRLGRLPHPNSVPCADCGRPHRHGGPNHHYHHHLGYLAKHHNDVVPLCPRCHVARDSRKKRQTHCMKGHRFDGENTYVKSNGTRACRECMREWDRGRKRPHGYWAKVNRKRRNKPLGDDAIPADLMIRQFPESKP